MLQAIKTMNLKELSELLSKSNLEGNKIMANAIIYEMAVRVYIPFNENQTFEDLLLDLGYDKELQKQKRLKEGK